jgi:mannose/fructose/N-acetylgalactosamine-specific phosphotransferase system component IID
VAIFAIGCGLGVAIASLVLTTPLGTVVLKEPWTHIVIVCGAGLVFGVLALIFQKTLIIVGTASFGSYMIASGVDLQWMKPQPILSQIIPNILSFQKSAFDWDEIKSNPWPYVLIAGMVVFAIAGVIVQTCFTAKNYDFRTGKTAKRDPFAHDDSTEPLLAA